MSVLPVSLPVSLSVPIDESVPVSIGILAVPEGDLQNTTFRARLDFVYPEGGGGSSAAALIDTGAALCLVRKGLIPEKFLRPAKFPKRFVGANGAPICGGDRGIFMTCRFMAGAAFKLWVYEAEIAEEAILSLSLLQRLGATIVTVPSPQLVFADGSRALSLPGPASCSAIRAVPVSTGQDCYAVTKHIVRFVCGRVHRLCALKPTVDAFANRANAQFPKFWCAADSALEKPWGTTGTVLWANPPFRLMSEVLTKWRSEGAVGVLVVPVWRAEGWWSELVQLNGAGHIRFSWFFPPMKLYHTDAGGLLPAPRWTTAILFLDCRRHVKFGKETVFCASTVADAEAPRDNKVRAVGTPGGAHVKAAAHRVNNGAAEGKLPKPGCPRVAPVTAEGKLRQQPVRPRVAHVTDAGREAAVVRVVVPGALQGGAELGGRDADLSSFCAIPVEHEQLLPSPVRDAFDLLKKEYADLGKLPNGIPPVRCPGPGGEAVLKLIDGAAPVAQRPYRLPPEKEEAVRASVQEFVERGWVVPTASPFAAPAFVVGKVGGGWRLVVDYSRLNALLERDMQPLPIIDDLIQRQSRCRVWTKLDFTKAFHQIPLHPDSRALTAFVTSHGQFAWTVLPMGLHNGPSIQQRLLQNLLSDIEGMGIYLDDQLLGSEGSSWEEACTRHLASLRLVFGRLRQHSLFLNMAKCEFFCSTVKFLGHTLSKGLRGIPPDRSEAISKMVPPKDVRSLKGFLGLLGYYSAYVPNFQRIALPLTALLPKAAIWQWGPPEQAAFVSLKTAYCNSLNLSLIHPDRPFRIFSDACDYAVGALLSQRDPETGLFLPVACFSAKLSGAQVRWPVRDKEAYAIIRALCKWSMYIGTRPIEVMTDHRSLEHWHTESILTPSGPSPRRARWHELLSRFQLEVTYIKGEQNEAADALSRWAYPATKQDELSIHGELKDAQEIGGEPTVPLCSVVGQSRRSSRRYGHCSECACDMCCSIPDTCSRTVRSRNPCLCSRTESDEEGTGEINPVSNSVPVPEPESESEHDPGLMSVCPVVVDPSGADWTAAYDADPVTAAAKQRAQADGGGSGGASGNFFWSRSAGGGNGRLRLGDLDVVPRALQRQLIIFLHERYHCGVEKLVLLVKRKYTFSGLKSIAAQVVKSCEVCAATAQRRGAASHQVTPPVPCMPFNSLAMDGVDLPPQVCGDGAQATKLDYCLVVVCRMSGFIIIIPTCKTGLTAQVIADLLFSRVFSVFGLPASVVSDQAPQFVSAWFQQVLRRAGVQQRLSTAYRPQGNGAAERAVKSTIVTLRKLLCAQPGSVWPSLVHSAQALLNDLPGPQGVSPNFLVFGRELAVFGDDVGPVFHPEVPSVGEWAGRLEQARLTFAADTATRRRAQNQRRVPAEVFRPGDWVWRISRVPEHKLAPRWSGPWMVIRRAINTYHLRSGDREGRAHCEDLKLASAVPSGGVSIPVVPGGPPAQAPVVVPPLAGARAPDSRAARRARRGGAGAVDEFGNAL
jgi:hypothetical protein